MARIDDEVREKLQAAIASGENAKAALRRILKDREERRSWEQQVRGRVLKRARDKIHFGRGERRK